MGGATLVVGRDWIGAGPALAVDTVLFTAGTRLGLVVAVAVPYLMVARHRAEPGQRPPVWLLAVVAPMVPAAQGPLLSPIFRPVSPGRRCCSPASHVRAESVATLALLPTILARLTSPRAPPPLPQTPTLFLVLGPLGQSATAVAAAANAATGVVPAPYDRGFGVFALLYGVPVLGFALLWLGLSAALVLRAAATAWVSG